MKRGVILALLLLLGVSKIFSQSVVLRTILIDSVEVVRDYENSYKPTTGVGSAVTLIPKSEVERNISRTLTELLLESTSLQIKSMGQGALATLSFRGTTSSHTKVLWNGIPITPPQLGSFDFSQVPVYFVDAVSLYHGGSISEGGTGAVGGSVAFFNSDRSVVKPEISFILEGASNNTYTGGVTARLTKGRLTSVTRAFYQESENDYLYLNKVYSKDAFYERRADADYTKSGVMQELYYRNKRNDKLYATLWWQYDDRSLPQPIMVNKVSSEQTTDNTLRALAGYDFSRGVHNFKSSFAYFGGNLRYVREMGGVGDSNTLNIGHSYIFKGDYRYKTEDKRIELGADMSYRYDRVVSENYEGGEITRSTATLRGYALYRLTRRLNIDAQATLEVVSGKPYGVYGVTARYYAIDKYLTLKASNSFNLRVPTLNDLYWYPGGNPDLLPEQGSSWDFTAESNPSFGLLDIKLSSSFYYMNIDNWIIWVPTGNGAIWSPKNIRSVLSRGVESSLVGSYSSGALSHSVNFKHTYARSTDNSGDTATDGKQLMYIPLNRWSAGYNVTYKERAWFNYNANFTDVRFTSDDESYFTDPYTMHSAELGYRFKIKNSNMALSIKAENIFNAYYESTEYYPMPLRMFWARLIINI